MSLVSTEPALALTELPPLSLYIHIPWCVRKCPYCDFNSHKADGELPESAYIACLIEDLENDLELAQGRPLQSIFFGGGTPSLFSGQSIGSILEQVEQRLPFANDIEITLEANPGTVEQQKFHDFKAAGINRLSIGVQSFHQNHLQQLGRIHSTDEAIHAASAAHKAGIDNFNLDLMHGLPHQTTKEALDDLKQALQLQPTHLSWYQLTIENNTEFYNSQPELPDEDTLADIQAAGEELLADNGFSQYEVSAYSREGRQSLHNLNYWQFGDYLGIGAGAHGKITNPQQQSITRNRKTRLPRDYMNPQKTFCAESSVINREDLPFEFMMNALRLNAGFSLGDFETRTGLSKKVIQANLSSLIEKKLLTETNALVRPTPVGRRYLNSVLETFIQS